MTSGVGRIPRLAVAVLGIITIATYGSWFYAFGVLLDPIIADTGWSETALTATYAAGGVLTGIGSLAGGWLMDRVGSRVVFGVGAVGTGLAFQVAAAAPSLAVFAVAAGLGAGLLGALGFYHVTQTAAVRVSPASPNKAIAVLTIWGAFASAIYLPAAAWLVGWLEWRTTLRVLTFSAVAAFAVGVVVVDAPPAPRTGGRGIVAEVGASLRSPLIRRFIAAIGLSGMGASVILVYQVPAMTAAGLPLATASFMAGFRGFAQLGGRVPLAPIVRWLGTGRSLQLAFVAIAAGTLLLAVAGSVPVALLYALVAGFGVGALSPLQGMYANEVFAPSSLGMAMGLLTFVFGTVGSVGPALAGWVAEATGSRAVPVAAAAAVALAAALLVRPVPERGAADAV
jgi:predicted MFS family arabinose efflux permease